MSKTKESLSIGEVLKQLKEEFPDVSISKIRFLESEGLIEPERTTSGYRQFSTNDLARLRFILRLQRDQFLPLKVIRKRLEQFDPESAPSPNGDPGPRASADEDEFGPPAGLNLSFDELVASSGVDQLQIRELEEFGLVDSHQAGDEIYYDEDDLMVAKIARDFGKYGIEPRHLKMFRTFAERESGLFEQVVIPRTRTEGGRSLTQSLSELAKLSKRLRHVLLKGALRDHLST
jgi:DNA-binding transcriptional MerR regulator